MLSQGCQYSPTIYHGKVAQDLFLFSFPTSVKCPNYIDDIMLTCKDLSLLQSNPQALLKYVRGWAVNPQKTPGLGTAIKFLAVIWLSEMCSIPEAVLVRCKPI